MTTATAERRSAERHPADKILRWKRPGRPEDHKAWNVDRAEGGIGFLTLPNTDPRVGEVIHLRVFDEDRWATVDRTVRIVHVTASPSGDLLMVGCKIDESAEMGFALVDSQSADILQAR